MFLAAIIDFAGEPALKIFSRNFFVLNTKAIETTELMASLWSKGGKEYVWSLVNDKLIRAICRWKFHEALFIALSSKLPPFKQIHRGCCFIKTL